MSKVKYLIKNISIFGISQFASKLLVFFLLPYYTYCLTTDEYGKADIIFSTAALLMPILTLQVHSAVLRFVIEDLKSKEKWFWNGVWITLAGFSLIFLINPFLKFLMLYDLRYFLYFYFLSDTLYVLIATYCKGLGEVKLIGITGVVQTLFVVICNLLFLSIFHWGLSGYLISYILGYAVATIMMIVFLFRKKYLKVRAPDTLCLKMMLQYSLPLVPNNIAWWGVSSLNKFFILTFLNEEILGLYSAALKIPSILVITQSIISEALVLSVLEQYREEKQDFRFYSAIYVSYSLMMTFMTFVLIFLSPIVASILLSGDFYSAWSYIPLLCISPVWGALTGYLGIFYSATKKNLGVFFSTILGAFIAISVSFIGIHRYGMSAILFGNILAYFAIWLYRWIDVKRYVKIECNIFGDLFSWIILIFSALIYEKIKREFILPAFCIIFILLVVVNYKAIFKIVKWIRSREPIKKECE